MKPVRSDSTAWKTSGGSYLSNTLPINLPNSLTRERRSWSDLAWKLILGTLIAGPAANWPRVYQRRPAQPAGFRQGSCQHRSSSPCVVALARPLGYKSRMYLYTPESVYALDRGAIDKDRISGSELMARAGERVWQELSQRWPGASRVCVFAGAGNNGGDAFVVADCARRAGVEVQLYTLGDLSRQSDSARHFRERWQGGGGVCETWAGQVIEADVIVDGLLGIGLQRDLDSSWQELIEAINRPAVPRVAIDIPSGLNGLTGTVQPLAVRADLTVTFIGRKTGQFLADGPDYCGELVFTDLGASRLSRATAEPALEVRQFIEAGNDIRWTTKLIQDRLYWHKSYLSKSGGWNLDKTKISFFSKIVFTRAYR